MKQFALPQALNNERPRCAAGPRRSSPVVIDRCGTQQGRALGEPAALPAGNARPPRTARASPSAHSGRFPEPDATKVVKPLPRSCDALPKGYSASSVKLGARNRGPVIPFWSMKRSW